jgi:RNA polymerase sigma-70 factor, ECF subfamily
VAQRRNSGQLAPFLRAVFALVRRLHKRVVIAMNHPSELDIAINTAVAEGRARWPRIAIPVDLFTAHVHNVRTGEDMLAKHGADLYFAFACLRRDRSALEELQSRILPAVDRHVARLGMRGSLLDDLRQELCLYLLADPAPRLSNYRGHGSLLGWLRIVAARRALRKSRRREESLDQLGLEQLSDPGPGPETTALRRMFGPRMQRALEASLEALSPQQKTLLRRHYAEGQSIDVIGARHRVHRATVARWLAAIRARITAELHRRLVAPPGMEAAEIRLLVDELRDELFGSVERFLREE